MHEISQINSHVIRKPVATILGLINLLDRKDVIGERNLQVFDHLLTTTLELDAVIREINEKTFE